MHIDRNHSWLPAGTTSPWWNLEGFLYLSDVADDDKPTRMVSVRDYGPSDRVHADRHAGHATPTFTSEIEPAAYAARTWPTARTCSIGPRRSTRRARHASSWRWPSSGRARIGSVTTRPSPIRQGPSGCRLPNGPRLREFALFGFPPPGHPIWTEELLGQVAVRYRRLDLTPWRAALPTGPERGAAQ